PAAAGPAIPVYGAPARGPRRSAGCRCGRCGVRTRTRPSHRAGRVRRGRSRSPGHHRTRRAAAEARRSEDSGTPKSGRVWPARHLSAKMAGVARVLSVANQKGGVAKTTTVASLGAALVARGRSVLIVDLDPQACLTFSLGHDPDKLEASVHEVLVGEAEVEDVLVDTADGMSLLPATIDLAGAEALLLMRPGREHALRRSLVAVAERFDVILICCPPSLGVLTLNGLTAADAVIVPLQCETLAHLGVGQLLRTVEEVQSITNPSLRLLGVLPTLFDARTTHSRDVLADGSDRYGMPV